jgi:hypothetical protein
MIRQQQLHGAHIEVRQSPAGEPIVSGGQLLVVAVVGECSSVVAAGDPRPVAALERSMHPICPHKAHHPQNVLVLAGHHPSHHLLGILETRRGGIKPHDLAEARRSALERNAPVAGDRLGESPEVSTTTTVESMTGSTPGCLAAMFNPSWFSGRAAPTNIMQTVSSRSALELHCDILAVATTLILIDLQPSPDAIRHEGDLAESDARRIEDGVGDRARARHRRGFADPRGGCWAREHHHVDPSEQRPV